MAEQTALSDGSPVSDDSPRADDFPRRMAVGSAIAHPWLLWSGLAFAALVLFTMQVVQQWPAPAAGDALSQDMAALEWIILLHGTLPRAGMALAGGAALGLAGLLLQRVLRNPLAEPSTLGIAAGAQLAMTVATIYAPLLMEHAREPVALVGGLLAVGLVLALTWRRGLEPVPVVLAGMMVNMTAAAASAAIILANGEYMFSLLIWGGGALAQQSWQPVLTVASRLAMGIVLAGLLLRPLAILGLDDTSARSLGVATQAARLAVVGVAVWLAATVTAEVGIIGFVGLAAPALAVLSGARTLRQTMLAAPLIGAILLWLTDGVVQLVAQGGAERIPTGAATALLGGPLLLWLLPRVRMAEWPLITAVSGTVTGRAGGTPRLLALLVLACVALAGLNLAVGRGPDGWELATGDLFADLSFWRVPHTVIAFMAGAMLAGAGVVLQRMTGNPLASPEILGVGSGAGVGLTVALFLFSAPDMVQQFLFSAGGAVVVLLVMILIATRGGFGPERLLLAGVAMGALCSAVLTAVVATGNMQAMQLLRWISGSTHQATIMQAVVASVAALVLLAPLPFLARWLEILPLGPVGARALGVPETISRIALVLLAGLLTAAATLFVGPLSFIGLIAPHMARLIGLTRILPGVAGAVLIGGGLLMLSDWLARMVSFPYQQPLGLFSALLGGPYLIWLLAKGTARSR